MRLTKVIIKSMEPFSTLVDDNGEERMTEGVRFRRAKGEGEEEQPPGLGEQKGNEKSNPPSNLHASKKKRKKVGF
ncbi:hypothetical protein DVH24_025936 [Malus domestica]|uniref:Uncharacterized protein n=1 Tax=Malus domestica TaxID=3750 RepID=A0A498KEM1_MALDO|nr:hypothetical protein DVH24_025936 [Malus domestica]